ncbi:MAG: hypothetical protein ACRD2R_07270 [Terriglobales bacterium]
MTDFQRQVLEDLAELKAQMRSLVGNGQPGRLREIEQRLTRHDAFIHRVSGVGAVLAVLLTLLHAGIDYLRLRP